MNGERKKKYNRGKYDGLGTGHLSILLGVSPRHTRRLLKQLAVKLDRPVKLEDLRVFIGEYYIKKNIYNVKSMLNRVKWL